MASRKPRKVGASVYWGDLPGVVRQTSGRGRSIRYMVQFDNGRAGWAYADALSDTPEVSNSIARDVYYGPGAVESFGVDKDGNTVRRNPPRRRRGSSADAIAKVRATNFGQEAYRGYLIRTGMAGEMWIEKGGYLIAHVPPSQSWEWARKQIDSLTDVQSNPPLVAFANPPSSRVVAVLSGRVYSIAYRHLDDGKDYKHDFKAGVAIQLLDDGSIRVYQESGKPLFRDY